MTTYRLAYDMNVPGERREKVRKYITDYGWAWVKISETDYLIKIADASANSAWDTHFAQFFDKTDRALLIEVSNNCQGILTEDQWGFVRSCF